jgi:hypothetical protein
MEQESEINSEQVAANSIKRVRPGKMERDFFAARRCATADWRRSLGSGSANRSVAYPGPLLPIPDCRHD